ncbi:GNAT family N-acetyltransferase [Stenotrophomonas sp. LMG 10879]|jgi:ribosomal-protein-alanine N-acetyltransferase|uniref:GNAT family N-acetyltransferase n=1 Tax=Stenotrophomonas sp. LMG 10879 TaxID=487706 RepID=UPI000C17E510|nr:GNAT family protein [Stenotrophomonas sp. LMG 10879]MBN5051736.1 GNAT family N-acetyltransferase [Stenotrophomonas maltophilia]PII18069.1 GNAT family N-acetyltransferase [Stenotrophomonas sp. LMG 10879]
MALHSTPILPLALPAHLRELALQDAVAWSSYLSLPGAVEHTSWGDVSVAALQRQIVDHARNARCRRWAILDSDDQLLGTVGLNDIDIEHRRAELAYDLSPAHQGRGLATEAARAVIAWAHIALGCIRIQATVLDSNLRSIAVLERVGMQREGLLRSYRHVRGQPRDFWMYAHTHPQLHGGQGDDRAAP